MSHFIKTHILAPLALVLFGLTLAACDLLGPSDPTHQFVLQADLDGVADAAEAAGIIEETMGVIEQRLSLAGTRVHSMEDKGEGRILISTIDYNSPRTMRAAIGARGELSFLLVDDQAEPWNTETGLANPGSKILESTNEMGPIAVRRLGGISGDRIEAAQMGWSQYIEEPVVNIQFDERGAQQFARISTDNVGKQFAIVIDDIVISAPVFNEPILGGQAQISGGFTADEANDFAIKLASGALPVDVELVSQRALSDGE